MTYILTAIILWLIWWLTPWPIIILSFSEILKSPKKWLSKWWMYVFIAWMTEFFIWLFLITSWKFLAIPSFIFHILSIIWILILLYLSYIIYKIDSISWDKNKLKFELNILSCLCFLIDQCGYFGYQFVCQNLLNYEKYSHIESMFLLLSLKYLWC